MATDESVIEFNGGIRLVMTRVEGGSVAHCERESNVARWRC